MICIKALLADGAVETHIIEPRFFLSSLDTFLIRGLVFLIPAGKFLNKVLICTTCLAWNDTVFSTRVLTILDNTLSQNSCLTILSYAVQLEKHCSL